MSDDTRREHQASGLDASSPLSSLPLPFHIARWVLTAVAYGAVAWLLWNSRQALLPFVVGAILIYLMLPLVSWLNKHMARWAAILVVYLVTLLLLVGMLAYIIPLLIVQTRQLLETIPNFTMEDITSESKQLLSLYEERVPAQVRQVIEEGLNNTLESIKANLVSYGQNFGTFVFSSILQVINTVVFVLGLIVVPIWMFHVMYDHRTIQRMLDRVVPDRVRNDFWAIARLIDSLLSSYIRGQVTLSIAVGSAVGAGLVIIGLFGFKVNYILLLAVIAGLTEFIPVVGPVLGSIPAVIVALFVSPGTVVAVIIVYAAVQALESAFLVPRIIGNSVGIHPAVIMILMIIAGQIFGFLGILLVAPVSAMSRDVFLYIYGRLRGRPSPPGVLPSYDDDDDESPAEGEQQPAAEEKSPAKAGEAAQPVSVEERK